MKKWFNFFFLGFFSHKYSREGARRGYTSFFFSLLLAFVFLWMAFVGGDMLPFSAHYNSSSDFQATVRSLLANTDVDKRIEVEVKDNRLIMKKRGGDYIEGILVNTFESEADRQNYSVNGYAVIVDSRPADTLAEIEAYCVSNDGKDLVITYEEYLSLSEVARLNFDFRLRYTGRALELDETLTEKHRAYVDGTDGEIKVKAESLDKELDEGKISKEEYSRAIYELYFTSYYPEISAYESTSKVPLLRNYYYHQYIKEGNSKYLFIFDDYIAASFEADNGIGFSFYGFYSDMENGMLITDGVEQSRAEALADGFIKDSYSSTAILSLYAYAMNVFSLIPFIALMPMVVTLLAYSILKLRGVESIASLGAMFKIIGSYVWWSAAMSAPLTVILAFFVKRNIISALPLVLFFVILAIRAIVFVITEAKLYAKQLEQQKTE